MSQVKRFEHVSEMPSRHLLGEAFHADSGYAGEITSLCQAWECLLKEVNVIAGVWEV